MTKSYAEVVNQNYINLDIFVVDALIAFVECCFNDSEECYRCTIKLNCRSHVMRKYF